MSVAEYRRARLTRREEDAIVAAVTDGAMTYREIGARHGVTRSTVARVVKRRGVSAPRPARVAPAVVAAIRPPESGIQVLVAPAARPARNGAPRPVVAAAAPGPLTRSQELELVDRAIAAGIGCRYERIGGSGTHIRGVHDALAWCDRAGLRVEVRAKVGGPRHLALYRVWRPGARSRAWIGAPELTALVRALSAHDAFRAVPLSVCSDGTIFKGVNPTLNPFTIHHITRYSVAV